MYIWFYDFKISAHILKDFHFGFIDSMYMSYLYMVIQTFYISNNQSCYSFSIDAGDEESV